MGELQLNWYNENEPYAAAWLGNLIREGMIPDGEVCTQDVKTVGPAEIDSFQQCHFFAGIGGWPLALCLAGWPEDREVWTGSCPCQPFSVAGKGRGAEDARHLWPVWYRLIAERRPPVVFGEQVASRLGREWLAGVRADLEALGYAFGCADLCAASVGAPHIRQRLWWVADANGRQQGHGRVQRGGQHGQWEEDGRAGRGVGNTHECGKGAVRRVPQGKGVECPRGISWLADAEMPERRRSGSSENEGRRSQEAGRPSGARRLGDAGGARGGRHVGAVSRPEAEGGSKGRSAGSQPHESVATGFWSDFGLVPCGDGKQRRVESGVQPLAHGVPRRVGKLRAYGNAIVPQVAATFIRAFMQAK